MSRSTIGLLLVIVALVAGLAIFLTRWEDSPPEPPVAEVAAPPPPAEQFPPDPEPERVATPAEVPEVAVSDPIEPSGVRLAGHVFLPDGDPAPDATVTLHAGTSVSEVAAETVTGPDGAFVLHAPEGGPRWLLVRAQREGFGGTGQNVLNPEMGHHSSLEQDFGPEEIVLTLAEEAPVSGILRTAEGTPAEGHELVPEQFLSDGSASATSGSPIGGIPAATVDGDGTFRLYGLREGEFTLSAVREGQLIHTWTLEAPAEGLELELPRADLSIAGRVYRLADGIAVAGADVALVPVAPQRGSAIARNPAPGATAEPLLSRSSDGGRYEFNGLLPGRYRVQARLAEGDLRPRWIELGGEEERRPAHNPVTLPPGGDVRADIHLYEGETIRGVAVVEGAEAPVEGVRVSVEILEQQADLLRGPLWDDPAPYATETGPEGEFALFRVFHPEGFRIHARAEGHSLRTIRDEQRGANFGGPVQDDGMYLSAPFGDALERRYTINLRRGVTISGRVVHASGSPATGAEVRFYGRLEGEGFQPAALDDGWHPVDARGRFTLGAAAYSSGSVTARGPGFTGVHSERITVEDRPVEGVEIVVDGLGSISGRIVDSEARALPRAEVSLTPLIPVGGGSWSHAGSVDTTSDADGRFRFEGVGQGRYFVAAGLEGYADSDHERLELAAGEERSGVVLTLERAETLRVRVVDAEGEPIQGVNMMVQAGSRLLHGGGYARTSDADGWFEPEPVPPSPLIISLSHRDHESQSFRGIRAADGEQEFTLRGTEERLLRVHVVDADTGEPVPGFAVTREAGRSGALRIEPGFFEDSHARPRSSTRYRVTADGYAPARLDVRLPEQPREVEETLELYAGAEIIGRVAAAESGDPLPGSTVRLYEGRPHSVRRDQLVEQVAAGTDGTFRFARIGRGDFDIVADPGEGLVPARRGITHDGREQLDVGTVEVGSGGSIVVRVLRDGEPAAGVGLRFEAILESRSETATTGADGTHTFAALPASVYNIHGPAGAMRQVNLPEDGAEEVEFHTGTATLELAMRLRGGTEGLSGAHFRLGGGPAGRSVRLDGTGAGGGVHRWEGLAAGEYTLLFQPHGQGSLQSSFTPAFTVAEGEERREVVDLPGGEIAGRVVDEEGESLLGASFSQRRLETYDNWFNPQSVDRGSGRFGQEFLEPGSYWIRAEHPEHGSGELTVELARDEVREDLELVLRPRDTGTLVSVALRFEDGEPFRDAWIRILAEDGRDYSPSSLVRREPDGVLTVTGLPPGEYSVRVGARGYSTGNHTVEITGGEVTYVDDVLHRLEDKTMNVTRDVSMN